MRYLKHMEIYIFIIEMYNKALTVEPSVHLIYPSLTGHTKVFDYSIDYEE